MEKLLIIYDADKVITVSEHSEGTAVVTPNKYLVETKHNALLMLNALGVDIGVLSDYENF